MLLQRLMAASMQVVMEPGRDMMLSDEAIMELGRHLEVTESATLLILLFALLLRGATPAECALYAATGKAELPFVGSEQDLLDALLDTIDAHPDARDAADLVAELTTTIEELLQTILLRSDITRSELQSLLFMRPRSA